MESFSLGHLNALLNQATDDLNLYLDHLNDLNQMTDDLNFYLERLKIEWFYRHVLGKTQHQEYQGLYRS